MSRDDFHVPLRDAYGFGKESHQRSVRLSLGWECGKLDANRLVFQVGKLVPSTPRLYLEAYNRPVGPIRKSRMILGSYELFSCAPLRRFKKETLSCWLSASCID